MNENWIKAKITEGMYKGKPVEVQFGKHMKILCVGVDITDYVVELHIQLDAHGQVVLLKLVEMNYFQVSPKQWERMIENKLGRLSRKP